MSNIISIWFSQIKVIIPSTLRHMGKQPDLNVFSWSMVKAKYHVPTSFISNRIWCLKYQDKLTDNSEFLHWISLKNINLEIIASGLNVCSEVTDISWKFKPYKCIEIRTVKRLWCNNTIELIIIYQAKNSLHEYLCTRK